MNIKQIEQEPLADERNTILTKVVFSQVESQCILARLAIAALGRPGIDTDLAFVGSGDHWTLMWTYPTLSLEAAHKLVTEMLHNS